MTRRIKSRKKRKRIALEKGRAPVPPPGSRHPDKKKEANKGLARGRVVDDPDTL